MKFINVFSVFIVSILISQSASAANVSFGQYEGEFVEMVSGAWSYSEKINFGGTGTYSMSLNDFEMPENFTYLGAMVSTATQEIARIDIQDGFRSSLSPVEFDIGEENYWVSIFALTGSQFNTSTFGLQFLAGSNVAEVPVPSAFIFMLSSLAGFFALVRRKVFGNNEF